jgi:hypothetical protein
VCPDFFPHSLPRLADISADGLVLAVRGSKVDVLRAVCGEDTQRETPIRDWVQWAHDVHCSNSAHPSQGSLWSDKKFFGLFQSRSTEHEHQTSFRIPRSSLEDISGELQHWLKYSEDHNLPDLDLENQLLENYSGRLGSLLYEVIGSMLFSTDAKRFGAVSIANAGRTAQAEDQVWAIAGCPSPLVLRPETSGSNNFILVGMAKIPHMEDKSFAESFSHQLEAQGLSIENVAEAINLI